MRGVAAIILMLFAVPSWAAEGSDGSALTRAETAYDDLDFDQAAKLFEEALEAPGTRDERLRAWRGLGMSLAFLGDRRGAQQAFETMLLIDPGSKVNASLGPKVTRPFDAAKKAARRKAKVALTVERDEESGAVFARLSSAPAQVRALVLHVKPENEPELSTTSAPRETASVEVPPHQAVTAWASAQDSAQGVLFAAGSPDAPLKFPATARPPRAVEPAVEVALNDVREQRIQEYSEEESVEEEVSSGGGRWPLWVGGAVAVVGGGVAAYFLTRAEPLSLPTAHRTGRLP